MSRFVHCAVTIGTAVNSEIVVDVIKDFGGTPPCAHIEIVDRVNGIVDSAITGVATPKGEVPLCPAFFL